MGSESSCDEGYSRRLSSSFKRRSRGERKKYLSESPSPKRKSRHRSVSPNGKHRFNHASRSKDHSRDRSRSGQRCQRNERSYSRRSHCKDDRERSSRKQRSEGKQRSEDGVKSDACEKLDDRDRLVGRAKEKLSVLAKLGIELKLPDQDKKKKLWTTDKTAGSGNAWEAASFADGKLTAKFQRLMGIKGYEEKSRGTEATVQDQEQLFKRMEAEYEVARQTTHTLRGAGLGFSK